MTNYRFSVTLSEKKKQTKKKKKKQNKKKKKNKQTKKTILFQFIGWTSEKVKYNNDWELVQLE